MNVLDQLNCAFTQYDLKESTKKNYNSYALGQYLQCAEQIALRSYKTDIHEAIDYYTNDRINTYLHKQFK